jgi:hypothetical protein
MLSLASIPRKNLILYDNSFLNCYQILKQSSNVAHLTIFSKNENITTMYSLFVYIFAFWRNLEPKTNLIQHVWIEMLRDFKFENINKLAYKILNVFVIYKCKKLLMLGILSDSRTFRLVSGFSF